MKYILITIMALVACSSFAQQVSPVAVHGTHDWRAGLSFPIQQTLVDLQGFKPNAWVLTDSRRLDKTYAGVGVSKTLFSVKNVSADLTAGWSADFSNLRHISSGDWGVGAQLSIRF